MNTTINQYVRSLNRRTFTKNVQRVLFNLLTSETNMVSRGSLRVPSATARLRDLRKDQYGAFQIDCLSSTDLGRTGTPTTFYRLNTNNITLTQLRRVFES
jgi:hypothetical protein